MIPPVPPNFGYSLIFIPVWEWEQVPEHTTSPAPVPLASAAEEGAGAAQGEQPQASHPDKFLVFKGYEWREAVQWSLIPSAVCSGCIGSVEADLQTDDEEARQKEWERSQHTDVRAPKHAGIANGSDDIDTCSPSDPSKPS